MPWQLLVFFIVRIHLFRQVVREAHVLDDEVADAVERVAKSRNKSRIKLREAS